LKIVWHMKLGTGYGPVAISKGRLFLFDRHEDKARLSCLNAETGKLLWKFDYPTAYRDKYGYNNGPRCGTIVDKDKVYIHGAEGMLHCVNAETGKEVWKVDTREDFGVVPNFFGASSAPIIEGTCSSCRSAARPPAATPASSINSRATARASSRSTRIPAR